MAKNKITRKERCLEAMKGYGSITPFYAVNNLGDFRLSATIFQLKKDGHEISMVREKGVNKFGDKITYAKYTLVKEAV